MFCPTPICNGDLNGTITMVPSGGVGFYQFSIDGGTTFQGSGTFTGLATGTYNLVLEDGNGCQTTSTETILNIAGPSITGVVTTDPTCGNANGDITITATGGTGTLQYSIDNVSAKLS